MRGRCRALFPALVLGFELGTLSAAPLTRAQTGRREVLVASDAIAPDVFEILRDTLSRRGIAVQRAVTFAPACVGFEPETGWVTRAWVSWEPGETVSLCFEDGSGRHTRALGPFTALDASAREQLITVLESSLDAAEGSGAAAVGKRSEPLAQPPAPESQAKPPPFVSRPKPARLALGLGYGVSKWADNALAHKITGMLAYALHDRMVYVGLEFGYLPPVFAFADGLRLRADCLQFGLSFTGRFTLYSWLGLETALGGALQRFAVQPAETSEIHASRGVVHVDPSLFARIGPTFALGSAWTLSLLLGPEVMLWRRSYGFSSLSSEYVDVLVLSRVRASLLACIRIFL